MSEQYEHSKEEAIGVAIEAWLTTVHAEGYAPAVPDTVAACAASKESLLKILGAKKRTSAAPLAIGRALAEGGMGIVKLATQEALGRTVVVKTLHPGYPQEAAEHVLREAWATGALEHPNIVPVHDIQIDDSGLPIIVLKRIEGESWAALMRDAELVKQRFGATDLLAWNLGIFQQVCHAIRYAHSRGIMHRDIKPANVMIGSFGEVYVVDWGIALALDGAEDSPLPKGRDADVVGGTPCYMAPEMLGGSFVDARTDIYLLGATLFEILGGRPPHSTENRDALLADVRRSSPTIPDHSPEALAKLCRVAMAKEPADRFKEVGEILSALQDYDRTRVSQDLVEDADSRLQALQALLQDGASRHEIYQRFGAVRFGFEAALEEWPENQHARSSLESAHVAMIEYELSEDKPQAANSLLEGLHDPHPALARRVQDATETEDSRHRELDRRRNDVDLTLGRRTRMTFVAVIGTVATILPFFADGLLSDAYFSYQGMLLVNAGFLALILPLWYWARGALSRTQINRRLSLCLIVTFPVQVIFMFGAHLTGMSIDLFHVFTVFIWGSIAINVSVLTDARFTAAGLGYFGAFLVSARWPEYRFYALAGGNIIMTASAIVLWSRIEKPEESP